MKTADTRCTTVTGRRNTDGTTQDNKRGLKTVFVSTLLPSRILTTEGWWLSQPRIRRELPTSRARCRAPCLLQSLDLRRQLSDSSLIFHLGLSDQNTDHGLHGLVLWNHGCVVRSSACSAPLETRRGKFSLFHCITCELCFQLVSHARRCARRLSCPSTHELRHHVD